MTQIQSHEGVEWVTGAVAATMLNTSHANVIALAMAGKLNRALRRISHSMVKPVWMYDVDKIRDLKKAEPLKYGHVPQNTTTYAGEEYVPARDAAKILGCSVNSIYLYGQNGDIQRNVVIFEHPTRAVKLGFRLKDVLTIRARMVQSRALSVYEQETVLAQTIEVDTKKITPVIDDVGVKRQIKKMIKAIDQHKMSLDELVDQLRKMV